MNDSNMPQQKLIRMAALFCLLQLFAVAAFAQEKFDIVTYTSPAGWTVQKGADAVVFSKEDKAAGTFCLITLYKSVDAGSDSRANFNDAWTALVMGTLKTDAKPQIGAPGVKDGWTIESGLAAVNTPDIKGAAVLTTATGGGKMLNVLVLTNSETFQKEIEALIGSIKLPPVSAQPVKPAAFSAVVQSPGGEVKLVGRWQRSGSSSPSYADPASWGTGGYTKSRYEFLANGEYVYTERAFSYVYANIIIVRESGRYAVHGNTLTISPAKSTVSAYKKVGGDTLGALVSSKNRPLETVEYKFTFHYFSGIQEWQLVLQADTPTMRDGNFSTLTVFNNAWYFDQKFTNTDLTSARGQ